MPKLRPAACLLALLAAQACGPGENAPGPGGVTMEESRALDEAAAMLEQEKLPPAALDIAPQDPQGPTASEPQQQGE